MKEWLKKLRERQNELVAEARSAYDQITDDTDETRAKELEAQHDAALAEYDRIEKDIERRSKLEAVEDAMRQRADQPDGERNPNRGETRGNADGVDGSEADAMTAEDAFRTMIQFGAAALGEHRSLLSPALHIDPEQLPKELRAQGVATDSAGGYTVPEGFMAEIVKSLAAWGPMLDANICRLLVTQSGNQIPWPTVDDTSNQGQLEAENTQLAEQDVTFGEKVLNAFLYSSDIVRVSIQLLQDGAFNMDDLLAELFGERLGRIGNAQLTTGTGSGQPNGIVTASTLGETAAAVAAITMDELINLQHSVDPAYRDGPKVRWQFNDSVLQAIRKLKDGQGNYLWQAADARSGEPASLLGKPYSINQAMAGLATGNRTVLFGDHSKYVVRRVRDVSMMRLTERYADFLQVGFLAFNRIDGELVDTAAVKHLVQA